MEVLQTSALPLGDGAPETTKPAVARATKPPAGAGCQRDTQSGHRSPDDSRTRPERSGHWDPRSAGRQSGCRGPRRSKKWSGKRDSNPRLRPWQGRTLPLSYSRPPAVKVNTGRPRQARRGPHIRPKIRVQPRPSTTDISEPRRSRCLRSRRITLASQRVRLKPDATWDHTTFPMIRTPFFAAGPAEDTPGSRWLRSGSG